MHPSLPLILGGLELSLDLLVQVVKHSFTALAVLFGVALYAEPLWVATASLFDKVVGPLHGFVLDVGHVDGLPLLPFHDIIGDAFRLIGWLSTSVCPKRLMHIWLRGRPCLLLL